MEEHIQELKSRFLKACETNQFDAAMDALSQIQAHLRFPLLFPEAAKEVSALEVDAHLTLLIPLMQLYFRQDKTEDVLRCCTAVMDLLKNKLVTAWQDADWRADCHVQHMRLACYSKVGRHEQDEALCKVAIFDGEKINEKTLLDLSLLLSVHLVLGAIYFNRKPRDPEDFRNVGNRIVDLCGRLSPLGKEDLSKVVALFEQWGRVSGGEVWLGYADQYRAELVKFLWKELNRFKAEQNDDEAKRCFVAVCEVMDEFDDVGGIREQHQDVDHIFVERWNFVFEQPGYDELFVADEVQTERRLFTHACMDKVVVTAEGNLEAIAGKLRIRLFSPYSGVGFSAKKVIFIYKLLDSLAKVYLAEDNLTPDNLAEAIRVFTVATQWTFLLRNVPQEVSDNIIDTYLRLFDACYKKEYRENLTQSCAALFTFCNGREFTRKTLRCLVNAHHLLGTALFQHNPEKMRHHFKKAEKYWEEYEQTGKIDNHSDIARANSRKVQLSVTAYEVVPNPAYDPTAFTESIHSVLRKSFLDACAADDLETADVIFKQVEEDMGFGLLDPSQIAVLLDEEFRVILKLVFEYAKLHERKASMQEAFPLFEKALGWFEKIDARVDEDWRIAMAIHYDFCNERYEKKELGLFFLEAKLAIDCGKAIKSKTAADLNCISNMCRNAGSYFGVTLKEEVTARKWNKQADAHREESIEAYLRMVNAFSVTCYESLKEKNWVSLHALCTQVEKTFDEIRGVIVVSEKDKEDVEKFFDAKKSLSAKKHFKNGVIGFVTRFLNEAYSKYLKRHENDKCQVLVDFAKRLYEKFPLTPHDRGQLAVWLKREKELPLMSNGNGERNGHVENGVSVVVANKSSAKKLKDVQRKAAAKARQEREWREAEEREKAEKLRLQREVELKQCESVVGRLKAIFSSPDSMSFFENRRMQLIEEIQALRALEYAESFRRDQARDAVIAACVDVVLMCDEILRCEDEIKEWEQKSDSTSTVEELRTLHQYLSHVEKLYTGGLEWCDDQENMRLLGSVSEWHDVEDQLHECRNLLRGLEQKEVRVQREEVTPPLSARPCFFFNNIHDKNELLVKSVKRHLQELWMMKNGFIETTLKQMLIGDICAALFKLNPDLKDSVKNPKHALYSFVQFLDAYSEANYDKAQRLDSFDKNAESLEKACQLLLKAIYQPPGTVRVFGASQ
ncbi:MAG TPA: hypothetical protein VGV92_05915 [Gammaproteobacteria bacterium]|nr:hypothetical protein [Gammaproteobacteria bacterium]